MGMAFKEPLFGLRMSGMENLMLDSCVMKSAIILFILRKLLAEEREQNCWIFSPSPPSLFLAQWAMIDQKTE